jgi:hypothetical protein
MSDHGPYSDFADMVARRAESSPLTVGTAAFGRPAAQLRSFFE